jgi:hypothetical protein
LSSSRCPMFHPDLSTADPSRTRQAWSQHRSSVQPSTLGPQTGAIAYQGREAPLTPEIISHIGDLRSIWPCESQTDIGRGDCPCCRSSRAASLDNTGPR